MKGMFPGSLPARHKLEEYSSAIFSVICLFLAFWLSFLPEAFYVSCSTPILIMLLIGLAASLFAGRTTSIGAKDFMVVLFLAIVSFNLIWVRDKPAAASYFIKFVLPGPILYFLFKNEFSVSKDKKTFLKVFVIFAMIVAGLAVVEFILDRNLIFEKLIYNAFYLFFLFQRRAMATQSVPQVLGVFLGALLPLFFEAFVAAKSKKRRLIIGIMTIIAAAGIFVTFTRGVFFAVFLAALFYAYFKNKKMWRYIILIFLTLVLFSTLITKFNPSSRAGAAFFRFSIGMLVDSNSRANNWKIALQMAKDHPFSGVGLAQFRSYYGIYNPEIRHDYAKIADNMYLTILAEGGVIVFLCFIFFIFILMRDAVKYIRAKHSDSGLVLALSSGLLIILIAMVYFDALFWVVPLYMFWIYCGLLAALTTEKEER